jgi:hypothetical protein
MAMRKNNGNTDLLKQYDFCKRCRHKAGYDKMGLSEKYGQKSLIFCGKWRKTFEKADLKKSGIFCDRGR